MYTRVTSCSDFRLRAVCGGAELWPTRAFAENLGLCDQHHHSLRLPPKILGKTTQHIYLQIIPSTADKSSDNTSRLEGSRLLINPAHPRSRNAQAGDARHFSPRGTRHPLPPFHPGARHQTTTLDHHPTLTATMAQTETSINIPQLLAVALVGFFALRWYMNKPLPTTTSTSSTGTSSSARNTRNRAVDSAQIVQISSMFPQLDARSIAWDLHRNGGNVAATSERVLSGRGLEAPPPSYQPPLPAEATAPAAAAGERSGAAQAGKAGQPDLITRYGLQGRIGDKGKEAVRGEEERKNAWTSDKAARAEGLRRRREEMVLEARRKMLEKDAGRA